MARVTIEDCISKVDNRFELVVLAAERAKQIASGGKPLIDRGNDKDPVVALREFAGDKLDKSTLIEIVTKKFQSAAYSSNESLVDDEDAIEMEEDMSNYSLGSSDLASLSQEDGEE